MDNLEKENNKLTNEIKELKAIIESYEAKRDNIGKRRIWLSKKVGGIFLGWRLKNSIRRLFHEASNNQVQSETLADVSTHVLWRFTRIGIFVMIFAILPSIVLLIQVFLTLQISVAANKLTANSNRLTMEQIDLSKTQMKLTIKELNLVSRQIAFEDYKYEKKHY